MNISHLKTGTQAALNSKTKFDITTDLSWIALLKGLAIIAVFYDNWFIYFNAQDITGGFNLYVGPFVQVFFILSGFGLTLSYLKQQRRGGMSWGKWARRRFTKILLPFFIAVLLSFALGVIGRQLYATVTHEFSWVEFLATLTLMRNFYPPSWYWNVPFWFMPIIVGLYISFPFMIKIVEKWGVAVMLGLSLLIAVGSRWFTLAFDLLSASHAADLFTFWLWTFGLGIALAYLRDVDKTRMRYLIGPIPFVAGLLFLGLSFVIRDYVPMGKVYNDHVTCIGVFLFLLNVGWYLRQFIPATDSIFKPLSAQSYYMYLVHYPFIAFVIGPLLLEPYHPIIFILICAVFIVALHFGVKLITESWTQIMDTHFSQQINVQDIKNLG